MPDPALVIAAISAVSEAIQAWVSFKDRRRTADVLEKSAEIARSSPTVQKEAEVLSTLIPSDVFATMTQRVHRCWERYHDVVRSEGDYLPEEIDEANQAVQRCICRELKRIHDLNGYIPEGILKKWWDAYCAV